MGKRKEPIQVKFIVVTFEGDEREEPVEMTDAYGPFDNKEDATAYGISLVEHVGPPDGEFWQWGVMPLSEAKEFWWKYK